MVDFDQIWIAPCLSGLTLKDPGTPDTVSPSNKGQHQLSIVLGLPRLPSPAIFSADDRVTQADETFSKYYPFRKPDPLPSYHILFFENISSGSHTLELTSPLAAV